MASKTRFQSKNGTNTKGGLGTASKYPGGSQKLQVFLNGKIVTPVSLLYSARVAQKKSAPATSAAPAKEDKKEIHETKSHENGLHHTDSGRRLVQKPVGRRNKKSKEEEMIVVEVEETDTTFVFGLPCLTAANDTRDVQVTEERNKKYEELKKLHENPDGYMGRSSQTLNNPQKNQNEMVAPNALRDMGAQAMPFEIDDSMRALNANDEDALLGGADAALGTGDLDVHGMDGHVRKVIEGTVIMSEALPGCLLDPTTLSKPPAPEDSRSRKKANAAANGGSAGKSAAGLSQMDISAGGSDALVGGASQSRGGLAGGPSATGPSAGLSGGGSGGGVEMGTQTAGVHEIDQDQVNMERQTTAILSHPKLKTHLDMLERAVQQNAFHRSHLDYRDLPDIEPLTLMRGSVLEDQGGISGGIGGGIGKGGFGGFGGGAGLGAGLAGLGDLTTEVTDDDAMAEADGVEDMDEMDESTKAMAKKITRLFTFHSPGLTSNRAVTSMVWNPANTDLLAVGYGQLEFGAERKHEPGQELDELLLGGLVLFWSLRNPEHPEKVLRTPQPVTSLDFSSINPTVLAVGSYNGDVNVYNLRRDGDLWTKPIATSQSVLGGHVDPVWQLQWVCKANDATETLVSISTDGAVLEWNLKKGLEVASLMQLMRGGLGDGWISRAAAGLCLDFSPEDPSVYFVGTEDGAVHRCSVSYSEQYLGTYDSHHGPVYKIKCCHRWPEIFASCSADWNVSLYHSMNSRALLSISATGASSAVNDLAWCPNNSTVLASVSDSGRLQVWDLEQSCIDPVVDWNTTLDVAPHILTKGHAHEVKAEAEGDELDGVPGTAGTAPGTAGTVPDTPAFTPFNRRDEHREDVMNPVAKLMKNLAAARDVEPGKTPGTGAEVSRKLTSVLFGKRSPTVVVGDRRGIVTMYRVYEPGLIRQEGPKQQTARLQRAVLSQTDPAEVKRMAEKGYTYDISAEVEPAPNGADMPPPAPSAEDAAIASAAAEGDEAGGEAPSEAGTAAADGAPADEAATAPAE